MRRLATTWSNTLNKLGLRRVPTRSSRRQIAYHRRPSLETLESRHMLSITVNTLVDENDGVNAGDVSLRDAIAYAATQSGFDVIDFDPSLADGVIELTHGQLEVDSDVLIDGLGMDALTIDADGASRAFLVENGAGATIYGLTITGGADTYGGGVYVLGSLAMDTVRVEGNTASSDGGGIYAYGTLSLESSIVNGNDAAASGGGIYVNNSGQATINGSTIDDNEAYYGGGVYGYLNAGENLVIQNSTLSHNRAVGTWASGGGMLVSGAASDAVATVVNSTISNNTASYSGAIRIVGGDTEIHLTNSTIAHNRGDESGGIQYYSGPSATLHNTIVAENTNAAGSADLDVFGALDSASSYNLIGSGGSGGLTNGTNHNIVLTALQSAGLAPLGDYGGLTKTHALLIGSPAIDAGEISLAVNADGAPLISDQRRHRRPFDILSVDNAGTGGVDIGAFEAGNPTELVVKTTDDELDDINASNFDFDDLSLREAIAISNTREGGEKIFLTEVFGEIYLGGLGELNIDAGIAEYHAEPTLVGIVGQAPTTFYQETIVYNQVEIIGPGAEILSINAHDASRVFFIEPGSVSISGTTITGGETTGDGGGILTQGNLTLSSAAVVSNQAGNGGGIAVGTYGQFQQYFGTISIFESTIANNSAIQTWAGDGNGGGIWGAVWADGTVFDSNHADAKGGGINGHTNLQASIVSNNSADQYGGIYYDDGSRILNSTIAHNTAENGFGGIGRPDHPYPGAYLTPEIVNSTIVYNDSGNGDVGGIYGGDWATTLINTIVAENTSGNGAVIDDVAGSFSGSHNLIGATNGSTGLTNPTSLTGTISSYYHPYLVELASGTFALPPGSPATDAGDDEAVTAYHLAFDQLGEGFPRILGDHVDIGATESHIILDADVVRVFGTNLDDIITVSLDKIEIDRLANFDVVLESLDEIQIDSLAGDDQIIVEEAVTTPVSANHSPKIQPIADQVVFGGALVEFPIVAYDFDEPSSGLQYSFVGDDHGASLSNGVLSWTPDWTIAEETTFNFEVEVEDSGSFDSTDSVTFSITVLPPSPQNVRFILLSDEQRGVLWDPVEGAVGYMVERKLGDGEWIPVQNAPFTGYFDLEFLLPIEVSYRVRAYNSSNELTPFSLPVSDFAVSIPAVVFSNQFYFHTKGPTVENVSGGRQILWSVLPEFHTSVDSYIVERLQSTNGGWVELQGTPVSSFDGTWFNYAFTDTTAASGTKFVYRVSARTGGFVAMPSYSYDSFGILNPTAVDLSFNIYSDGFFALNPPHFFNVPDNQEETVGYFLPLNNNFDQGNKDVDGNPIPDNEPAATTGEYFKTVGEDRQVFAMLFDRFGDAADDESSWTFDFPSAIRLWRYNIGENSMFEIQNGVPFGPEPWWSEQEPIWVEAIEVSQAVRDVELTVTLNPGNNRSTALRDTIRFTVGALTPVVTTSIVSNDEIMSASLPIAPFTTEFDDETVTLNLRRNGTVIETVQATIEDGEANADFESRRLPNMEYTVEAVFRGMRGAIGTLATIDLDIDSDNNGPVDLSVWEETLEDHAYGLGKLLEIGAPPAPVILKLAKNLNPNDPNIRVRFDWDPLGPAGHVKLWKQLAMRPGAIDQGGDRIHPEIIDYSLSELDYDPTTGEIIVYAQGTSENPKIKTLAGVELQGKPSENITATLVMNGRDVAHDEVKYLVVTKDSFFYHLQTRREVRNALASRAAYASRGRQDLQDFSLRRIDQTELIGLGVPAPEALALLGPPAGHDVAGFSAVLYQDYITGDREYVLAFGGTETPLWADEWADWINNVEQAAGFAAAQYDAAMFLAHELVTFTPGIPNGNLITTGHSLGGGLASAAAVVGNIPADTFNAAGLHRDTLLATVPNVENAEHDDWLARFDIESNSQTSVLISASYVDYDLLTAVQKYSPIPNAIGANYELDSPFDVNMVAASSVFAAGVGTLNPWLQVYGELVGGQYMVRSHLNDAVLYGLLVEEGSFGGIVNDALGLDVYSP